MYNNNYVRDILQLMAPPLIWRQLVTDLATYAMYSRNSLNRHSQKWIHSLSLSISIVDRAESLWHDEVMRTHSLQWT